MAPQQTLALLALLVSLQPVRAKPHSIIVAPRQRQSAGTSEMSVKLFCTKPQAMPSSNIGYYVVFYTFKNPFKIPTESLVLKYFVIYLGFFFGFLIDL